MPTLCGVRRRGYTAEALKMFCEKIGVSKRDQMMDIQLLEWCVRQDLNARANRYMVVQKPLKVTLTNWEPGKVEPAVLADLLARLQRLEDMAAAL